MPHEHVRNLIIDLHDSFAMEEASPSAQQQQLMQQLQHFSHNLDEAEPTPLNFSETAELLLEEVEESYPKTASIIREVINSLGNMGI